MNKDYIVQKIVWYRHLFTFVSAITVGCIAWLFGNYDKAIIELIIINVVAIAILFISNAIVVYEIRKYLKKMRDI